MSLKNVTSPETNVRELEFDIEKDVFEAAVTLSLIHISRRMRPPGRGRKQGAFHRADRPKDHKALL